MSDDQGATPDPTPAPEPTDDAPRNEDAPLGEAGQKALDAFKQRAREAEAKAKASLATMVDGSVALGEYRAQVEAEADRHGQAEYAAGEIRQRARRCVAAQLEDGEEQEEGDGAADQDLVGGDETHRSPLCHSLGAAARRDTRHGAR